MSAAFRFALRGLLRSPLFAVTAILTLGLGIGANALVYSVTRAAFLAPLPFAGEERIVALWTTHAGPDGEAAQYPGTPLDLVRASAAGRTLEAVGGAIPQPFAVQAEDRPITVQGARVSASLWRVLGAVPIAGRTFTEEEDIPAGGVAVISEAWQRRYYPGIAAAAVGRDIVLDGQATRIVGVMPDGFTPLLIEGDVWVPLGVNAANAQDLPTRQIRMAARLSDGATPDQAAQEIAQVAAAMQQEFPLTHTGWGATAQPLREALRGNLGTLALTLTVGSPGTELEFAL